jgi:hypothetical protein
MKKFLYALLMISIGFSIKLVLDIIYDIQHNYPVDDDEYGEEDCGECVCPCCVENTENEEILEDRYTP